MRIAAVHLIIIFYFLFLFRFIYEQFIIYKCILYISHFIPIYTYLHILEVHFFKILELCTYALWITFITLFCLAGITK